MSYPKDITNIRFGRLVVLHRAPHTTNGTKWRCLCDCGNERDVLRSNLVKGNTQSCSCLNKEIVRGRDKSKHNMTASLSLLSGFVSRTTVLEGVNLDVH